MLQIRINTKREILIQLQTGRRPVGVSVDESRRMEMEEMKSCAEVPLDWCQLSWSREEHDPVIYGMAALHLVLLMDLGKYAGGKIFNETFSGMKGWKDHFLFIDRRAIPDVMMWRNHDSDVYDAFPNNDFSTQDIQSLTERVIDLRLVPSGLLFGAGLATTSEFPGYLPVFKDTEGNVVTMSEYLRFPFLSGASITRGATVPANHLLGQNTTPTSG
ncbi:hypothetical protein Tco_1313027 [Tanacetum coccineum]